ncbi:F-box protein SKIP19-like [Silene latifolia]|uniref:F-box protein SKIP19-like n=1 Tax=Silene latifolia TaxID=37657 RepID=UPI003D78A96D
MEPQRRQRARKSGTNAFPVAFGGSYSLRLSSTIMAQHRRRQRVRKSGTNAIPSPFDPSQVSSTSSTDQEEEKFPDWIELPSEIWFTIFSKLKTMDIIENVQKVCRLFRTICKKPSVFDTIDMSTPVEYGFTKIPFDIHTLTRHAIYLSAGRATDIYVEYTCEEKTLRYIGQRCKSLKKLRLSHFLFFPDELSEALIETIKRLSSLEEVQLRHCTVSEDVIERIGHACPSLTSFDITKFNIESSLVYFGSQDGIGIPNSMPNLRRLTLTNIGIGNSDLKAILDGCPNLEYLDLRGCRCMDLSGDLGRRCERIKHVRHPHESIEDVVAEYELWHQHRIVENPDMKLWHERASQCT